MWSRTSRTRDPTMFAAASDNYSMFTFDVTSAYTHAWEDELVFFGTASGGDRGT